MYIKYIAFIFPELFCRENICCYTYPCKNAITLFLTVSIVRPWSDGYIIKEYFGLLKQAKQPLRIHTFNVQKQTHIRLT